MEYRINCKYCKSDKVIKYGKYKRVQYYYCKDYKRKFAGIDTIPKMQYSTDKIADVLNMYYEGMSLMEIRRNLIQQYNDYISDATAFNWVKRFTNLAVADETVIDIDGKNVWFWDIIDTKTRFLLASHMSYARTSEDAKILMDKAYKKAGEFPRVIYTDKLRAYLEGIEHTFDGEVKHRQGSPFDIESHHNYIERFHGTIKSRTKVMRGLHTIETAKLFMDGWLVHYNFFRPHMSLRDMTPAMMAGIRFPFRNWKDVVEQPYEVTARIPMNLISCKPKQMAIKKKITRQSKPTPAISSARI